MHVKHKQFQDINDAPYVALPTTVGEGQKTTIGKKVDYD